MIKQKRWTHLIVRVQYI